RLAAAEVGPQGDDAIVFEGGAGGCVNRLYGSFPLFFSFKTKCVLRDGTGSTAGCDAVTGRWARAAMTAACVPFSVLYHKNHRLSI
ncbi:MAG: hypothetical protein LUF84_04270, partial [Clostridiales bacterium]|nr:hypothetical protein [Clostridiales bacterium]